MIEKDEFEIWLANPVTEYLYEYLLRKADQFEQAWWAASWIRGDIRPELLADLRASASILRGITELEFEDIEEEDEQKRNYTN